MSKKRVGKPAAKAAELVAIGLNFHRKGDLREAQSFYRRALESDPHSSDALHLLGVAAMQEGDQARAEATIRLAIEKNPRVHWYHNNLGLALKNQGRLSEATDAFEHALRLQPEYAEAIYNRGLVREEEGRLEEALDSYRQAIRTNARYREANLSLGRLLERLVRYPLAVAAYEAAIDGTTQDSEGRFALAGLRVKQERLDDAIELYHQILAQEPAHAPALNNLGELLRRRGQFQEAAAALRAAVHYRPQVASYRNNLASVCNCVGAYEEAIAACEQALALDPTFAQACNNWGNALERSGRLTESLALYQRAIELEPGFGAAWSNLAGVQRDLWDIPSAVDSYHAATREAPDDPQIFSNYLLSLLYAEESTRASLYAEHSRFQRRFADPLVHVDSYANRPDPGKRLRVGFVSADLHEHSVSCFLENLLRHHDPERTDAICFSLSARSDAVSARLKAYCYGWVCCAGLSGEQLAMRIAGETIDVLIELGGHTADNALTALAYRPAPVQVSYLGYPETTGLEAIDYRLTDNFVDPEGVADRYSSERLLRLPGSYFCYAPPADAPPVADSPSAGVGYVTFGSFNNSAKINLQLLALWAEVLRQVPASRLLLKTRACLDTGARSRLLESLQSFGVSPERILFVDYAQTRHDHLETYARVDIALDSFPYNGATTTCEALWMGVPVVSLAGDRHAGRMGLSILTAAGFSEWVARDRTEYVRRCVDLAGRSEFRRELRQRMRDHLAGTPLLQGSNFAEAFEARLREAWTAWVAAVGSSGETAPARPIASACTAVAPPAQATEGRRLIAFSLWGDDPRYLIGALKNARLAERFYPGWRCRFYIDARVPEEIARQLRQQANTEVVRYDAVADYTAALWRFAAAGEENVDVVLFRDADSRLGARERAAVDAWLAGGRRFHIMRDHPAHQVPIMAGMWGVRDRGLADIARLLAEYLAGRQDAGTQFDIDQHFLSDVVFPRVAGDATIHDDSGGTLGGEPFPTTRDGNDYVGKVFLSDDRVLPGQLALVPASERSSKVAHPA